MSDIILCSKDISCRATWQSNFPTQQPLEEALDLKHSDYGRMDLKRERWRGYQRNVSGFICSIELLTKYLLLKPPLDDDHPKMVSKAAAL